VPSQSAKIGAAADGPPPARILIVEDDFLVATQLETGLTEAGYQIAGVAMSADEAIALAKSARPTLAIVDVHLIGRRDGVEAAIELFQDHGVRSIFATAHADPETRRRAQPAAPAGWLAKPYSSDMLLPLVRAALATG
jgi:DNA-binding NarL/FixJ family response regulator